MSKAIINSYEEFEKMIGQQIGVSDWLEVTQERINQFADATLDHQWIHVDVERAKVESPFKSTIVHGYLTLSLLPYFWNQIIEVNNLKMMVNYGMDKMKFGQAVLSGQKIRMVADLIIPLDTHVCRVAFLLGLTDKPSFSLSAARCITEALAEVFPGDPCLGDFALFGYGVNHPELTDNLP